MVATMTSGACGERADICLENCGEPLPTTLTVLANATDDTVLALMMGAVLPRVGLNHVYYRFSDLDSDATFDVAAITQVPQMTKGTTVFGCPTTDPGPTADEEALFAAKILFTMPTEDDGSWTTQVQMTPDGGSLHTFDFGPVPVAATDEVTTFDDSGTEYVVSLALTEGSVHVGNNPFTISVHALQTDSNYVAIEDAHIRVIPFMTSMGHGSAGNIDPEFRIHGEYDGSFNLSMRGGWDVRFEIRRGGDLIGTVSYDFRP